jgi:hypothetical protein
MSGDKRSPFHGSRKKSQFKEQGKRTLEKKKRRTFRREKYFLAFVTHRIFRVTGLPLQGKSTRIDF